MQLSLVILVFFALVQCTESQFLTKEKYEKEQQRAKEGPVKLNPLQELEDEVRLEGYSIYKPGSNVVNHRDEVTNITKLMMYAVRGEVGECKHQIVQGADMELTNKNGETPLLMAISRGNYHSAIELLRGHANMHHRDNLGFNALHTAIASGQQVLVEALLRYDDSWRNGIWSSQYFQPPLVDTVLPTGMSPLMMCSQDNEEGMLKMLLEHGAKVNARSTTGETALMYSSITGNVNIVKILLRYGGDPRAANDFKFNSVMMAANRGHLDVIKRFTLADKDNPRAGILDDIDDAGHCALDHAILSDYPEVAEHLIASGAKYGKLRMPALSKDVLNARQEAIKSRSEWNRELEKRALEEEEEEDDDDEFEEDDEEEASPADANSDQASQQVEVGIDGTVHD